MNKQRRKWLADVISQLEEKRDELWNIYEDEEMAYDNLPKAYRRAIEASQCKTTWEQ